ncbi:hypothetical protein HHI36_006053 [Cryptolaemus montrouzieri]|uniref:Uncharacterized protein n=1 Tax=Cryptolaemus montrouzieri TaxID=559131 RepID=A0ABD2NW45_9CUCU
MQLGQYLIEPHMRRRLSETNLPRELRSVLQRIRKCGDTITNESQPSTSQPRVPYDFNTSGGAEGIQTSAYLAHISCDSVIIVRAFGSEYYSQTCRNSYRVHQQPTSTKVTFNKSKHKYKNNSNANNNANYGQPGKITIAEVNAGINQAMKNIPNVQGNLSSSFLRKCSDVAMKEPLRREPIRPPRRQPLIVGKSGSSALKSIPKTTLVHVSRVDPHTSEDDLK